MKMMHFHLMERCSHQNHGVLIYKFHSEQLVCSFNDKLEQANVDEKSLKCTRKKRKFEHLQFSAE